MGIWSRLTGGTAPIAATDATPAAPNPGPATARDGSLQNIVAGLGTNRDKRFYAEYGITIPKTQAQLDAAYEGSWLAGKVVDIPAGDMTREWVKVSWEGYDDDKGGARELETAEAAHNLRGKTKDAATWGRLYGGSGIIAGIRGDTDYSQPLDTSKLGKDCLESLTVVDRYELSAEPEIDTDLRSPNYGRPVFYRLTQSSQRIHWTRIVLFGGRPLPRNAWIKNGRWDASVLTHVLDSITNYDATRDGAASMMYEAVIDVLKTKGLFELLSKNGGEAKLIARFQAAMLLKGINRSIVIDKDNEEYEQKSMQFGGVTDVMNQFTIDVCGAADIPMTRLFGQSPAGLTATGESDIRNYYDKIKADQERALRGPLTRLYEILLISVRGAVPENFSFRFNSLWQPSDKEVADVENVRADRDKKYIDMKVLTAGGVARELHDKKTYRTMEDEDVDLAEEVDDDSVDIDADEPDEADIDEDKGTPEGPPKLPDDLARARAARAAAGDAMPGDAIKHEADGWHAYAGDVHVGGPYKRHGLAMRRLRKYDRSYRK